MKGIRSFSGSLSAYVDNLPEEKLFDVICEALIVCREEHSSALPICNAIEAFLSGRFPDGRYSEELSLLSSKYDTEYINFERSGELEESQTYFRRMCVTTALSCLFAEQRLSLPVVDDALYDIAASFKNFEQFGVELEARTRRRLGDI